jgi:hypothetical protein
MTLRIEDYALIGETIRRLRRNEASNRKHAWTTDGANASGRTLMRDRRARSAWYKPKYEQGKRSDEGNETLVCLPKTTA